VKKKIFIFLVIFLGLFGIIGGIWAGLRLKNKGWVLLSPLGSKIEEIKEKPLEKYSFERLKERGGISSKIVLEREISRSPTFTSYLFSYISEGKKITGLVNVPDGEGPFPVIVMLRGWVDPAMYETGLGTQRAGEVFAQNGYITLAPDYLGYGESDIAPNNVWEERFLKNINIMDLLASVDRGLNSAITEDDHGLKSANTLIDSNRIGIWGHSNGGLSALTVLELTGKNYPTTLWAPVTQFFPYDILYYTDEFEDKGKALRKSLAELEKEYDVDKYSFDEYLDWIKAPIQVHQGTNDPYIPVSWSESLVGKLEELGNEIKYYTYPGAGHHMEGSWDLVIERDIQFFKEELNF